MAGIVYALLVGINDYGGNPKSLSGCVADVEELEKILDKRIAPGQLQAKLLLDRHATRRAVLEDFASHLGKAGQGDVALFAFSGHGSVEPVEERFWFLEPTGQNQTLVLADSRRDAGDLADKELSELIRAVADNGPHVVVILDCCHSGGGTRDPNALPADVHVRQAPPLEQPRPLESYLEGVQTAVAAAAPPESRGRSIERTNPTPGFAHPRHIALSACESTQLAKEIADDGGYRGVFSVEFQRALTTLPASATYRDLLRTAQNRVRNRVSEQAPVALAEGEELDQPFLGGALQPRPATITISSSDGQWWIDAGIVHGIQLPQGAETTTLAVLDPHASEPGASPLGYVKVVDVQTTASRVEPVADLELSTDQDYAAVVVDVPIPPMGIELRGDPAVIELVRSAMAERRSAHIREVAPDEPAAGQKTVVLADNRGVTVARADRSPLTDAAAPDETGARRAVDRLEHLARWYVIKDLENPTSTLAGQVTVELVEAARGETPPAVGTRPPLVPDDDGVVRRDYVRSGDGWDHPYVFAYIHNRSDCDLYCTLLDLTDRFRCHNKLFPVDRIASGHTAVAFGGRPIDLTIPTERLDAGGTQVWDWLKLIACEQRFEPDAFDLDNLDGVLARSARARGMSTIDRLAWRAQTRDAGDDDDTTGGADWTTTTLTLLTRRPPDGTELSASQEATIGDGSEAKVAIAPHPALGGVRAALGTSDQATRALQVRNLAPMGLVRDPAVAVPLTFSGTRATEGALDHVELRGEIDVSLVTPQQPIQLRLRLPVDTADVVLAVARDGDLFLPLGTGERDATGWVQLDVERLPEPSDEGDGTRGLGRSIRIFFQRVIASHLGVDPGWPRLSVVRRIPAVGGGGETSFELNRVTGPTTAIDEASTLLLVVHGILGDTRNILPPLLAAVGDRYDTVLAFDYDSIGPGIRDSAAALGQQLAAVGLTPDGSRQIDVVAVSSGAVLVRCFVEQLGGASLVRHAVLAGVPNQGTPWVTIKGWATAALTFGLNGLAKLAWPAAVLGGLVGAMERSDHGIDDLKPGSDLLTLLAQPPRAASAYTVLVGDAALIGPAMQEGEGGSLGRLLRRLGDQAADLAFFRQPNDLAVSTISGRALPKELSPPPTFVDVPCDHLSYVHTPAGVHAIADALG